MANKQVVAYTDEEGKTWKCRLSPATVAAQTTAPGTADFDNPIFAKVGGSRRGYGVHVRYINIYRTLGASPNQYTVRDRFPVMFKGDIAGYLTAGQVVIGGVTWKTSTVTAEKKF